MTAVLTAGISQQPLYIALLSTGFAAQTVISTHCVNRGLATQPCRVQSASKKQRCTIKAREKEKEKHLSLFFFKVMFKKKTHVNAPEWLGYVNEIGMSGPALARFHIEHIEMNFYHGFFSYINMIGLLSAYTEQPEEQLVQRSLWKIKNMTKYCRSSLKPHGAARRLRNLHRLKIQHQTYSKELLIILFEMSSLKLKITPVWC